MYAPKRYNLAETYDIRVNLTLLIHNERIGILIEIMKQLNLTVSTRIITQITNKEKKKKSRKKKKKQEATKTKRMEDKAKKKKRRKKVVNKKHTYKEGNTPNDEDDGKSLTREPKAKKMRQDTVIVEVMQCKHVTMEGVLVKVLTKNWSM